MTGLLSLLLAAPAFADEAADVTRLLRAGQLAEAVAKADAYLAQKPRDAQMRFLKGVVLTEMNKPAEAIAIFAKLIEEYPALPEPHNNIAVLYAANGQYDKARAALDMAIRTNPAYATAYENLGDVHAKLASQAYDKALQLDSGNSVAKSKLTLLKTLGSAATTSTAPGKTVPAPVSVAQAPKNTAVPAAPPVVTAAAAPQAPARTEKPAEKQAEKQEQKQAEKQEQRQAEKQEQKQAEKRVDDQEDEVLKAVNGWAKAWSARDFKAYLDYYAGDFQTPGNVSRKAWAAERQSRIQDKGSISVSIQSPRVSINGNTATVNFRQVYVSDRLKANSRKTLVLTRQGGKWQIRQEQTGN